MARTRERVSYVEAVPKFGAYDAMLAAMAFAMVVGILALLLELGDYTTSQPPPSPPLSLPKATAAPAPKAAEGAAPAPKPAPAPGPMGGTQ